MKAREAADFSLFAPVLQEWVDLLKKYAAAIDPTLPGYDVLLDDYEKGMTSSRLNEIFTEVRVLPSIECPAALQRVASLGSRQLASLVWT